MTIFKRGSVYWYKFMWDGKMIREPDRGMTRLLVK